MRGTWEKLEQGEGGENDINTTSHMKFSGIKRALSQ